MAAEVEAVDVKDIPGYPKQYQPATGKVFFHGENYSTHLNIISGDDETGYTVIPMLVPGQKDIEGLLSGKKATAEQYRIAEDYARAHLPKGVTGAPHKTVDEALAAETAWHDAAASEMQAAIRSYQDQRTKQKGAMTGGRRR